MDTKDKKIIAKNIGWLTSSKILIYLLSIITITIIPRYLGVLRYGQLNFAISFIAMFSIIANIGIGILIFRDVSKNRNLLNKYFNNFFYIKIDLILLFMIFVLATTIFIHTLFIVKILIILLVFNTAFKSFTNYLTRFTNAYNLMKYDSLNQFFFKFFFVILLLLVIYFNLGLIGVTLGYVLASLFTLIFIIFSFLKVFKNKLKFKPVVVKKFLLKKFSIAWPFALIGLFGLIYFNFDKFMISFINGNYQVGLYSIGYSFFGFLIGVVSLVSVAFFPELSRAAKTKRYKNTLHNFSKIIYFISVPLFVGAVTLSKQIISLVFGSQYLPGQYAFCIIMFFFLVNAINQIFNQTLTVYNLQKFQFKIIFLAALSNIILNFIFIPKWGIIGAGITTVISEIIVFIGITIKVNKDVIRFNIFKNSIIPVSSSIVMFLGIYLFKDILKFQIFYNHFDVITYSIIGGIIYIGCILLFRYYKIKDFNFITKPIIARIKR